MWLPWKPLQGLLCSSKAEPLSGFPFVSQRSCPVLTSHRLRRGSESWTSATAMPKKASLEKHSFRYRKENGGYTKDEGAIKQ